MSLVPSEQPEVVAPEVLPREDDDAATSITLTIGEARGLWQWIECDPNGPRYWEDHRLASLQSRLRRWVLEEEPW